MRRRSVVRWGAVGALLGGLGACSSLQPSATAPPALHALDSSRWPAVMPRRDNGPSEKKAARTLILDPPQAGPGLDTRRMLYTRTGYRIDHFANHEWVDTPAHMLGPLAVQALRESTTWGAVVPAPGAVRGDMRLSLQILQLQHTFQHQPSQIEFTLRAYLSDATTRRVIAWRDIAARAPAPSETPHGGVLAANAAVHQALLELVAFVTASVP